MSPYRILVSWGDYTCIVHTALSIDRITGIRHIHVVRRAECDDADGAAVYAHQRLAKYDSCWLASYVVVRSRDSKLYELYNASSHEKLRDASGDVAKFYTLHNCLRAAFEATQNTYGFVALREV